MERPKLNGTGVALVTPFKNKRVDFEALERVIEHCIAGGVDFLVSLGTTGEAITLSREECRAVLNFTIKINNGRLPLVAGYFGDNDTERVVQRLKDFNYDGIDAIMSSCPAYNKPTQEGLFRHYMAIESAAKRPIIIYNVPSRTACNLEAETTLRLADESDKFIAVKEASGDLVQAMRILKRKPDHFNLLSGDDQLTLPLLGTGASGVISVIANAFPVPFSGMVRAARAGDYEQARKLNESLLDIHPWLYCDGNPAGIKAALAICGICLADVRLPLVPATSTTRQNLKTEIEKLMSVSA